MKTLTLTVEQTRDLDRRATEEFGIPSLLLMESAGRGLAHSIQTMLEKAPKSTPILFLCGGGSNGGDGYVAARYLFHKHYPVTVFRLADPPSLKGEAAVNYRIIDKLGVPIKPFEQFLKDESFRQQMVLIVDAILGTGFHGPPREPIPTIIRRVSEFKKYHNAKVSVVAVDIPSGLDGDEGLVTEPVMQADLTVTFACLKPGLLKKESKPFVGRLELVDIGIPERLLSSYCPEKCASVTIAKEEIQ